MVSGKITLPIFETLDRVSAALDRKNTTIRGVHLLTKAFDTNNHSLSISKLHHYDIRALAYDWFKNYLSDRL